eukprot:12557691-Alexandrium_andersonii.AAC.2
MHTHTRTHTINHTCKCKQGSHHFALCAEGTRKWLPRAEMRQESRQEFLPTQHPQLAAAAACQETALATHATSILAEQVLPEVVGRVLAAAGVVVVVVLAAVLGLRAEGRHVCWPRVGDDDADEGGHANEAIEGIASELNLLPVAEALDRQHLLAKDLALAAPEVEDGRARDADALLFGLSVPSQVHVDVVAGLLHGVRFRAGQAAVVVDHLAGTLGVAGHLRRQLRLVVPRRRPRQARRNERVQMVHLELRWLGR